jgi:hypothetical protein
LKLESKLGAVASFISMLLGRMGSVLDRVRFVNALSDDDPRQAGLRQDLPRLHVRVNRLHWSILLAIFAGIVTTMLIVATRSGASLADLLERLCTNLRARQHLERKVEVMTTQGKMQAWVMGALPVVLLLVLSQVDPLSVQLLHSTSVGQAVLATIFTLECLGVYVLRRILAIDV